MAPAIAARLAERRRSVCHHLYVAGRNGPSHTGSSRQELAGHVPGRDHRHVGRAGRHDEAGLTDRRDIVYGIAGCCTALAGPRTLGSGRSARQRRSASMHNQGSPPLDCRGGCCRTGPRRRITCRFVCGKRQRPSRPGTPRLSAGAWRGACPQGCGGLRRVRRLIRIRQVADPGRPVQGTRYCYAQSHRTARRADVRVRLSRHRAADMGRVEPFV